MLYCPCQPNPISIMKEVIFINTNRSGYSVDQIYSTLTVEELINLLSEFDPESKVYLRNDNGYTFGSVSYEDIFSEEVEENE